MTEYLAGHPRYHTMNSWNRATSYSRNIKLRNVRFPDEAVSNRGWALVCSSAEWWEEAGLAEAVADFNRRWDYRWQLGTNGRSGGYLVLYQGGTEPTGYQSYCTACGQRNYAHVAVPDQSPEGMVRAFFFQHPGWRDDVCLSQAEVRAIDVSDEFKRDCLRQARADYERWNKNVSITNVCGKCHAAARVNYDKPPTRIFVWSGRGVDMDRDYADWDKEALADRVAVVWDLDRTAELMAKRFIEFASGHEVVEETITVPKTVQRARKVAKTQ